MSGCLGTGDARGLVSARIRSTLWDRAFLFFPVWTAQERQGTPNGSGVRSGSIPSATGRSLSRSHNEEGQTMKLDELLESRHIPFERLHHRPAYTANRVAQTLHVPGKEMAKTVLLRTGRGGYVVAVLPATHQV